MLKFSFFQGFNDSERLLYKAVVYSNIVQSMLAILRAMKDFDIPYEDDSLEHTASRFFEEAEGKSKKKHRPGEGPRPKGANFVDVVVSQKRPQNHYNKTWNPEKSPYLHSS